MENRYKIFERYVINIEKYNDIFCTLNKDKNVTTKNVLKKIEHLETVDFTLFVKQDTIFRGTLLHAAVTSGYKKIVKALLECGADIEAKCAKGFTPLHYAVIHDKAEVMELLINENANVKAVDLIGSTPLHLAAAKGSPRLVKLLLSAGAEVNVTDRYCNSPLHFAVTCIATGKSTETVRTLVNFGADVNARDELGNTVLHRTILYKDNSAVLEGILLTSKIDILKRDVVTKSAMINRNKYTDNVVELLLKQGAVPEVRNYYGNSVLHCSIIFSSANVIRLLARYGADCNTRDTIWRAPLQCLDERFPFSRDEASHIVYTFIKKGADINSRCPNDLPTLKVIMKRNRELAKLVIRWAVIDNPARETPKYVKYNLEFSKLWDSFSRSAIREQELLSTKVEHKAIFDLLRTTNQNKLANLINDENVFSKLNYCEIWYPAHAHEIICKYEKGWKRFHLLKMSEVSITKLCNFATNSSIYLPKEIGREISYYLTNKEIKNVITALYCSGHSKRKLKLE